MNMTRQEAFDELYALKGYPEELKEGLYPIFEDVYKSVLERMSKKESELYVLDPDVVLSYLFEEHFYNFKAMKVEMRENILANPSYVERLKVLVSDKIYINEFKGYENKGLMTKYNPLVSTYSFFLNFILNKFESLENKQDVFTAIFLDILKKGFVMSKGVLSLLTNGFETEAFSTWRTIHEVECIVKILHEKPYLIKTYVKHIEYARYYRTDNGDPEKQDALFKEIKEQMKVLGLKSKDMKKFVEYGYLYEVKNLEEEYPEFKPNFRKGVQLVAGLSNYSSLYELSSEIAHSSPLLIYSNRAYFKSLCIINLYDTFFRLEDIFNKFLLARNDIDSSSYFNMRKDYLVEMKKNIAIEKGIFSLTCCKRR